MSEPTTNLPVPVPSIAGVPAYNVPRAAAPVDVHLDGNEGAAPPPTLLRALVDIDTASILQRYPDTRPLEAELARRLGVHPAQVVVTAGGDDAIDRACRAVLAPGRELIFPAPGFEMLARYARLAGATILEVPWPKGDFPTAAVLAAVTPHTAMIAITSPNNPTGAVASPVDLARLAAGASGALLLVDLAYVEFADRDLTAAALALPQALVIRTFSKAWGLAGARVGYAIGAPEVTAWLRAAGAPYSVAAPSLALAAAHLADGEPAMRGFVARVREERTAIAALLESLGARPFPSQANFVLSEVRDPLWLRDAMAGLGIGIRAFPGRAGLERHIRIACPGDAAVCARVEAALATVLSPQAILFDMDGVLADVSRSYRAAVLATAAALGVRLDAARISAAKAAGNANNDWELTWRLVREGGSAATLAEVTSIFEALYQGTPDTPGLRETERLLPTRAWLADLALRLPLAVVTGRPRADALRFLEAAGIAHHFAAVICMEDAALKPDPAPVRLALERLGVTRAWLVGDTPDDLRAARAAGVLPLGIRAPGDDSPATAAALSAAGAARILPELAALETYLP